MQDRRSTSGIYPPALILIHQEIHHRRLSLVQVDGCARHGPGRFMRKRARDPPMVWISAITSCGTPPVEIKMQSRAFEACEIFDYSPVLTIQICTRSNLSSWLEPLYSFEENSYVRGRMFRSMIDNGMGSRSAERCADSWTLRFLKWTALGSRRFEFHGAFFVFFLRDRAMHGRMS